VFWGVFNSAVQEVPDPNQPRCRYPHWINGLGMKLGSHFWEQACYSISKKYSWIVSDLAAL